MGGGVLLEAGEDLLRVGDPVRGTGEAVSVGGLPRWPVRIPHRTLQTPPIDGRRGGCFCGGMDRRPSVTGSPGSGVASEAGSGRRSRRAGVVPSGAVGPGVDHSGTGAKMARPPRSERLALEQGLGQFVEDAPAVGGEQSPGPAGAPTRQAAYLAVDPGRHLVGVVGGGREVPAEEHLAVGLAEPHRPEGVAHAVLGDHRPGDLGRPLDVVLGAGRRVGEDQLLGRPAAERASRASRAAARPWDQVLWSSGAEASVVTQRRGRGR